MGNPTTNDQNPNGQGQQETDEEIREKVIDEFGVDPDENDDLVEKLVEREKQHKEQLGKAIQQKIKYRKKAKSQSQEDQDDQGDTRSNTNQGDTPDVEQLVEQKLQQRELENMDLPDKVKKEVKDLAQFKSISVREAANHDYIQDMKERIEREERATKATPKRNGKAKPAGKTDPSQAPDPANYDFDSEDGRKAWDQAKAAHKKWKRNNG